MPVQLLAELPDQFSFGPGQPVVVDGHSQQTLLLPAVALHIVGAAAMASFFRQLFDAHGVK